MLVAAATTSPQAFAPITWDEEAQKAAWQAARENAGRDPEAAALLMQHLNATPAQGIDPSQRALAPVAHAYNPMQIYARLVRFYRFSHTDLQRMDYRAFFGYVREMQLMIDESQGSSSAQHPEFVEAQILQHIPHPVS